MNNFLKKKPNIIGKKYTNVFLNRSIAVDELVVSWNPKKSLSQMMTMRVKMKRLVEMTVNYQQNQKWLLQQMKLRKRR